MDRYDVAIVGGGIIGLYCAWELRRAGIEKVIVLEREHAVGQWASSRANGGFRAQFTTPINISFSMHSIAELERLNAATNGLPELRQTGYLLFTGTTEGEAGLRSAYELQRSLEVPTEWLEPDEICERAPIVRRAGLIGGTFHERDGFLDPHGVLTAIKDRVRESGAAIATGAPVDAITPRRGGFAVRAGGNVLETSWLVDAAGAHAGEVGALAGVDVPVHPVRRNLAFMPDPSEDRSLIPMCVDLDTGVLIRKEISGGYLLAYSNPADAPGWDTSVDPRFLEDLAERIGNRFPSLADVPVNIKHCWAGLYPETEDHHAIVGVAPELERFIVCAGFGGHGIMHSPAAGRAVAELISAGACTTFDLHPLRPSRFGEGDLVVEAAVL